jgi:hypothetical protein
MLTSCIYDEESNIISSVSTSSQTYISTSQTVNSTGIFISQNSSVKENDLSEEISFSYATETQKQIDSDLYYFDEDKAAYEERLNNITIVLDALIIKNEDALINYINYPEGKTGWLYTVNFKDYRIISYNTQTMAFEVELDITESSDSRFPIGKSKWRFEFGLSRLYCRNIELLDDTIKNKYIGLNNIGNRIIDQIRVIAYGFTITFPFNNNIDDISNWNEYIDISDIERHGINPLEFISYIDDFGYASSDFITEEVVDKIYSDSLGIIDSEKFVSRELLISDHTDDYIRFDSLYKFHRVELPYTIDDFYNNVLTMTYYADSCFLTPAVTVNYHFVIINDIPQLKSLEIVTDYGYEPCLLDAFNYD